MPIAISGPPIAIASSAHVPAANFPVPNAPPGPNLPAPAAGLHVLARRPIAPWGREVPAAVRHRDPTDEDFARDYREVSMQVLFVCGVIVCL